MKYSSIEGVAKPVSRIVQGTAGTAFYGSVSDQRDYMLGLFDDALEQGITTFDMAHNYGGGDVERFFGHWLKTRGVRDEVVILTKGAHHSQDRKRVTPFDIESDIQDSLARLGTDFLEIYLLHRDDESQPVGPIVAKLDEYHRKGVIGIYGGSNWSIERLQEANAWAAANGAEPFRASSPNFSLADQVAVPWEGCRSISGPGNHDERAWYQEAQMPLFTWSSLAGGFFSGRFRPDNLDSFSEYYDRVVVDFYCSEDNFERLARAQILALEKSLTVAQIAVAYIFNSPLNVYALIASRSAEELQQNIEALELELSPAEMAWLDLLSDTR